MCGAGIVPHDRACAQPFARWLNHAAAMGLRIAFRTSMKRMCFMLACLWSSRQLDAIPLIQTFGANKFPRDQRPTVPTMQLLWCSDGFQTPITNWTTWRDSFGQKDHCQNEYDQRCKDQDEFHFCFDSASTLDFPKALYPLRIKFCLPKCEGKAKFVLRVLKEKPRRMIQRGWNLCLKNAKDKGRMTKDRLLA